METDMSYTIRVLKKLLAMDSPSGYTSAVMDFVESQAQSMGYEFELTRKGNGMVTVPGMDSEYVVGFCAHVDTLGLIVSQIKEDGAIAFDRIGGINPATLDGELCRVHTRQGVVYEGTIYSTKPSAHVFGKDASEARTLENLELLLDECPKSKQDVLDLGIRPGDYICVDPRTIITEKGLIKSRYLDDKLSAAILLGVMQYFSENSLTPRHTIKVLFSTYEEVGTGMAWVPPDVCELIGVDMGCVGGTLSCTQEMVSICAKDSSGPYDYSITSRLVELAEKNGLNYAVDIYPHYGSDVSAALTGGQDIQGGLIGPGVYASHGYERSTVQAAENTMKLLIAYWQN